MESKHTPGPWIVDEVLDVHQFDKNEVANVRLIHSKQGDVAYVAYHSRDGDCGEREANAALIAAAPALLEALEQVTALAYELAMASPTLTAKVDTVIPAAHAAIAQAKKLGLK